MKITVVITGRSYHAAEQLPHEIDLPDGSHVDDALQRLAQMLPEDGQLPSTCLVAVAGKHLGTLASHSSVTLNPGDELALIAPVAGG